MTLRLPCALDRAQVGPERFGSKGTNHNSYRSIQLNAGRREVSIRRLRRARGCWPRAACWQTVTGCWCCTWHRGPRRTRQGCRKSFQDLRQRGLPDRLAPRGSKGPEQGRFGAISRRSAGTPASGGRYSRWHPQRVERFQPLYKLRDNGPNSSLRIAEPGRGPAFKRLVLVACVWRACHYSAIFLNLAVFCILLTNFTLTNYYPRWETKE